MIEYDRNLMHLKSKVVGLDDYGKIIITVSLDDY